MVNPVPTRITIELSHGAPEPVARVEIASSASTSYQVPGSPASRGLEPADGATAPRGYEPVPCSCLDGPCDADHEHE